MARYHDTGRDSFFGEFAYERLLKRHSDHFLVVLDRLFDWDALSERLIRVYKGKGKVGRAPYPPVLLFKMLFISYLCKESERSVEQLADVNLLVKWFLRLAVDEAAPDHSTLTAFKRRFLGSEGWEELVGIFDAVIREGQELGVQMGGLQVLDSVHTAANVNPAKDRQRQAKGKGPRDPDAKVVHKGKRQVVEPSGKAVVKDVSYCGYKTHASVNAGTGLVTSIVPAPGNSADNKAFPALRAHDRALELPTRVYGGDKAYDDTDIYERLAREGLETGITIRDQRLNKKDGNRERWERLVGDRMYQEAVRQRFRVEQPFGIAKLWHGFDRCRYVGFPRYRLQSFFTFLVLNAKRIVTLVTGVLFRPQGSRRREGVLRPGLGAMAWA